MPYPPQVNHDTQLEFGSGPLQRPTANPMIASDGVSGHSDEHCEYRHDHPLDDDPCVDGRGFHKGLRA